MQNLTPTPPHLRAPIPDFTPVPRKYRYDGWTPERQCGFVAALAETGSVKAACKRINMSTEGAYYLRRQPGAEGFRQAWAAALDHGVQCLADIAIDRAIEGVPVPVFYKGEVCGEKRWFNDRLLMFILKHHMPSRYGANLSGGTRQIETLRREWEEERLAEEESRGEEALDEIHRRMDRLRLGFMKRVAQDPAKRAAWDLLVGPADWPRIERARYGDDIGFSDDNMTAPSTIVILAGEEPEDE